MNMIDGIISDVITDCSLKYFHSLNNQFHIYDLNFTNIKNNKTENIMLENERGGQLPLLMRIQKIIIDSQKKYRFNEINKLTIKVQEDISELNICYLKLTLPIPAVERAFHKKNSI